MGSLIRLLVCIAFFVSPWVYADSSRTNRQCASIFSAPNLTFEQLYLTKSLHVGETENSAYYLLKAVSVIDQTHPVRIKKMNTPFSFKVGEVSLSDRFPTYWRVGNRFIPIHPILAVHSVVEKSMMKFGLEERLARSLGFQIQKSIIEALNLKWSEYLDFLKPPFAEHGIAINKSLTSAKAMLEATEQIARHIELDMTHEIPYFAGYSKYNFKKIYIDRDLFHVYAIPFLIVHEVVEKVLIDALRLKKEEAYLTTHQIAQRLEMAAIQASGISWRIYQHEHMAEEIARSEDPDRILTRVPLDIDLTPYKGYKANKLIQRMRAAGNKDKPLPNDLFVTREIMPGVFYLMFEDRIELAKTMVRFQEHFESPRFKDTIFSIEQFEKWYRSENDGKFDYYDFWGDGFNIPGHILEPFFNGKFKNITDAERLVLERFKNKRHTKYYIIATAKNSETKTFDHEIAHSLYYLNPKYRAEVDVLLKKYDVSTVEKFLKDVYGDYHDSVLRDEAHAWLMHNSKDLAKDGFNTQSFENLIERLNEIYLRYTKN